MTNEVRDLIAGLREGSLSLEEVAQRFRKRSWPRISPSQPTTYLEMAAAANRDPEADVPGSFDEVVGAYDRGEITHAQYRVLAEAVAEAIGLKQQQSE